MIASPNSIMKEQVADDGCRFVGMCCQYRELGETSHLAVEFFTNPIDGNDPLIDCFHFGRGFRTKPCLLSARTGY
jgi:hypothetical protein